MAVQDITLDQLLAEYARLGVGKSDDGLTVAELAKRWRLGPSAVLRRLHMAKEAGVLRAGRKQSLRLDNVPTWVPCYRIELPKKGQQRKK